MDFCLGDRLLFSVFHLNIHMSCLGIASFTGSSSLSSGLFSRLLYFAEGCLKMLIFFERLPSYSSLEIVGKWTCLQFLFTKFWYILLLNFQQFLYTWQRNQDKQISFEILYIEKSSMGKIEYIALRIVNDFLDVLPKFASMRSKVPFACHARLVGNKFLSLLTSQTPCTYILLLIGSQRFLRQVDLLSLTKYCHIYLFYFAISLMPWDYHCVSQLMHRNWSW